ncbi:MAG: oligosaccharide flippase family protein [Anaerolineaceae bacterium]|nr:oligosaccharide flippase family protein [Anaerolineaceae bacterium]
MKQSLNKGTKEKPKKENGIAVKAGMGYTIGNFLVKGITFLTLPLFSRIMTTAQFGVYNVFVSYEAILYVIVGLAIHTSIQSANLEFKGRVNEYTSSVSLIYIVDAIILSIVTLVGGSALSELLKFNKEIIYMLVMYSFGTSLMQLYNNKISLKYDYKQYIVVTLAYSAGSVLLSIILMLTVYSSQREMGRIVGTTISAFAVAVWILITLFKEAKPRFDKQYWSFALKYSLPIVPHGISQVLLAQFDRIMIRTLVNDSAAGIYSLAANIKLIMTVITNSITTAWRTWFYKAISENRIEEIQKRARQLVELYAVFAVGLMSVSHEVILIFGGQKYDSAKYVVIPMIMDAFILFIYSIVVQSEYYKKKTHYIMIGTIIATVINIITNYVFIKMYGFVAAAYTTLFSYVVYLILHLIISYKVVEFSVVPMKSLLLFIGIVALDGALNLVFVDNMLIRWIMCLVIAGSIGIHFIKDTHLLHNKHLFG